MKKLTKKQTDVMQVLWGSQESMTAHEITEAKEELNINTVQACLKVLLKGEYIRVADIVTSGTVLCRSYAPALSKEDYIAQVFGDTPSQVAVAQFIEATKDQAVLDDLQAMIDQKRKQLERK